MMGKAIWGGSAVLILLAAWIWIARAANQRAEADIREASAPIVQSAVHSIDITVNGRDVTVSGIADSTDERARLLAALKDIPSIGQIEDSSLVRLDPAAPFSFAVTRKSGRMIMQGNVPTEDLRAAFTEAGLEGGESLTLASGAPERWETVAGMAVAALAQMKEGSVALEDNKLRVSGLVQTTAERDVILAALILPKGYELNAEIEMVEPAVALDVTLSYDANSGASIKGLAPSGITAEKIETWLGLPAMAGVLDVSNAEKNVDIRPALQNLRPVLARVEALTLTLRGPARIVQATVLPGADPALIEAELYAALGKDADLTVRVLQTRPTEGATRVNAATGLRERVYGGVWMPDGPFAPSLEACNTRARDLLDLVPVSFVAGRAEIDAQGQKAIPVIADLVRRCTQDAGLTAQIQGHTDNRGSSNFQLSAARSVGVREALIALGALPQAVSAVGFGASNPVADNATAAGRAANRRITIVFGQDG